ncbi:MAG: winged helix-turn-helix transcriptional regulator [Solirubrobacterales bacterium]|nr:winged helix-turn-helix transcriptional regulator [Solirubrobacterales bacterium]
MVQYLNETKAEGSGPERAFGALADPVRMRILERLESGGASISELAEPAGMSLTGMKKHVRVLEEAKLVVTEKRGRTRWCELADEGFDEAAFWLDEFRRRRHSQLNRLEEVIERRKRERQK